MITLGDPQTLREPFVAVGNHETGYEGVVAKVACGHRHQTTAAARSCIRAALASPDSLRLDPEDPESVERLRDVLHYVICDGTLHVTTPCAQGYATAIAREWKASALPDPAPEAPTGRFGRCAKCGTDIDVDGGCRCPTAPEAES